MLGYSGPIVLDIFFDELRIQVKYGLHVMSCNSLVGRTLVSCAGGPRSQRGPHHLVFTHHVVHIILRIRVKASRIYPALRTRTKIHSLDDNSRQHCDIINVDTIITNR